MTREQQLADAIDKADLPARDYRIYRALFKRAAWKTAEIRERWQPRSLQELAVLAHMSKSNVCYGLDHLELHGWVIRHRHTKPGRGYNTAYSLTIGRDCDCRKASKPRTHTDGEVSKDWTAKCPKADGIAAGQRPVSAKRVREEEERERTVVRDPWPGASHQSPDESWKSWPAGSVGAS